MSERSTKQRSPARQAGLLRNSHQPPSSSSAGKVITTVSTDEDFHYAEDFDVSDTDNPVLDRNPMYIFGEVIDEHIHPLDEFTAHVDGEDENIYEDLYDEEFESATAPTSPVAFKSAPEDVVEDRIDSDHPDSDDGGGERLREMSSVTFAEEDDDIPYDKASFDRKSVSAGTRTSQPRVYTAPKHRMVVTPARNAPSQSSARSDRATTGTGSNVSSNSSNNNKRIVPRPPSNSNSASKQAAVKFQRIKISTRVGIAAPSSSSVANSPSHPSIARSHAASSAAPTATHASSKHTLPTKGSSTVITTKIHPEAGHNSIAGNNHSNFHQQQEWHTAELQRQLTNATKRMEDYKRSNEILRKQLDESQVHANLRQLQAELTARNVKIKELQQENSSLRLLSRYQERDLVDKENGFKEDVDIQESQERFIAVLNMHITRLKKALGDHRALQAEHEEQIMTDQALIKKLRAKINRLKKKVAQQKEELSAERVIKDDATAANDDDDTCTLNSHQQGSVQQSIALSALGMRSAASVAAAQDDASSVQFSAYLSQKIEKKYAAQIQILKRDLVQAKQETVAAISMQQKLEHELERRELLVRRQVHEMKSLRTTFDGLLEDYKQLQQGCALFRADAAPPVRRPTVVPAPAPVLTVPSPVPPAPLVAIVATTTHKVAARRAVMAGDDHDDDDVNADVEAEIQETVPVDLDAIDYDRLADEDNNHTPSSLFLTSTEILPATVVQQHAS